jgi:hypothetical protein
VQLQELRLVRPLVWQQERLREQQALLQEPLLRRQAWQAWLQFGQMQQYLRSSIESKSKHFLTWGVFSVEGKSAKNYSIPRVQSHRSDKA